MLILGVDTSNYTTSAALWHNGRILQQKLPLPVKEGELGLRQSDAIFHHTRQLPEVLEALFLQAELNEPLAAVGASERPRSAEGSYMPCFLAGVGTARAVAAAMHAPLFTFSHQEGHLAAALYSAGQELLLEQTFLAFHVSGGTTECLLVKPGLEVELLGGSADLKAGQLVDRIGVMLGYSFPAGAALDALAQGGLLQKPIKPTLRDMTCSFSGYENQCRKMHASGSLPADIALYCLSAIAVNLESLAQAAFKKCGELPLVFSGGVCCSRVLRKRLLEQLPDAHFADPIFSSDNAAGIALLAAKKYCRKLP